MNNKILLLSVIIGLFAGAGATAGPEEDRTAMLEYYTGRFPDVPLQDFANGLYAFDEIALTEKAAHALRRQGEQQGLETLACKQGACPAWHGRFIPCSTAMCHTTRLEEALYGP